MVPGKHVLYFALQPPPEAQAQALALANAARGKHRLSAKPVPPERLHVSLNNVGAFKRPPGPVVDKALEAVEAISARPFVVQFNRMGSWGVGDGERPMVLWGDEGVIGVNALYSTIHKAMRRLDMAPRREAEIAPHMTLLRDRIEIPETFIEPVSWAVDAFVLIHAIHGEGRFEVVGRVPLNG
jgi:2'-5' RNA ligase